MNREVNNCYTRTQPHKSTPHFLMLHFFPLPIYPRAMAQVFPTNKPSSGFRARHQCPMCHGPWSTTSPCCPHPAHSPWSISAPQGHRYPLQRCHSRAGLQLPTALPCLATDHPHLILFAGWCSMHRPELPWCLSVALLMAGRVGRALAVRPCYHLARVVSDTTWLQGATCLHGTLTDGKTSINDLYITVLKAEYHYQICGKLWHATSTKYLS